jgi:hypothetical protein
MNAHPENVPSLVDRIKQTLVALKMPPPSFALETEASVPGADVKHAFARQILR